MRNKYYRIFLALTVYLGLGLITGDYVSADSLYSITDLGTLGGSQSSAWALMTLVK